MKTIIHSAQHEDFKMEIFKDSEIDELTGDAYEIIATNITTGEKDSGNTARREGSCK